MQYSQYCIPQKHNIKINTWLIVKIVPPTGGEEKSPSHFGRSEQLPFSGCRYLKHDAVTLFVSDLEPMI